MINKLSLVSVGIPTYNRPGGLRKTLESITRQTYKNLEIIVSDNCSTDPNVTKIVSEFTRYDQRIKYFRHSKNKGALNNFQFVLREATGEYFMWATDDDWLENHFIEYCHNFLSEYNEYSIVGGQAVYVDQLGQVVIKSQLLNLESDSQIKRVINYYKHISKGYGNTIFYGLMQKDLIAKAHLSGEFAGDSATVAEMAFIGKIKTLNSIHIYYNLGGISKSIKKMVAVMNLPKWNECFPGMASAWVFIKSILFSDIYTLGVFNKIYLSFRVFLITSKMYEVQTIRRFFIRISNIARKIKTIIKKTMMAKSIMI